MTGGNYKAVGLLLDHMAATAAAPEALARARDIPHAPDERVARFSLSYLDAFGYLAEELDRWRDITVGDIVDAIKNFQDFFGLPPTGEVTAQTVRAMEMPRCGCPDVLRARHAGFAAVRDFAAASLPRWTKTGITYQIQDYLPALAKTDFEQQVYAAFQKWCRYSPISVNPATGGRPADIIISTGQGPQSNFDGPGGTLAWAYLPDGHDQQLLMKFDLGETWVLSPQQRGIVLANVACHEFGHLLGLSHSKVQSALMAPYYNAATDAPQADDDIPRLQARYGARPDGTPPPAPPPATPAARVISIQAEGKVRVTVDGRDVVTA